MPNLTEEEQREFPREIIEILDNHSAELTAACSPSAPWLARSLWAGEAGSPSRPCHLFLFPLGSGLI